MSAVIITFNKALLTAITCLALALSVANPAYSQEQSESKTPDVINTIEEAEAVVNRESSIKRLKELEEAIRIESKLLAALLTQRGRADASPDLAAEIAEKQADLKVVEKSFEQIVTGGVGIEILREEESPKTWQEELTLVVQPLLENLRGLTEVPRQKENLRRVIAEQRTISLAADKALLSIDKVKAEQHGKLVKRQLTKVAEKWSKLKQEADRKRELALFELATLNGEDSHWLASLKSSLVSFAQDRGLTLVLALFVAILIVLFFKGMSLLIEYRRKRQKKASNRTAYRVVAYAQRILTMLCVIVGVLIVFFVRGDVLLLALSAIVLFAAGLGLRHLLPQFINESRLLLNIGSVRENERVVIDGVPWRVASINMFCKLVNPEIKGVLRLPLSELNNLNSRSIGGEKWFPSSIGDWVLDDADHLYEVIEQSPDTVELQSAQGTNKLMPTQDYFRAGFVNLTKSQKIRITSQFGVDYALQGISLDEVPEKFAKEIQQYLLAGNLGTEDIHTRVEFKQAGESSLDYLVIVNINSSAASQYYRIQRYIQQACVQVCNRENWSIPFPQITMHTV